MMRPAIWLPIQLGPEALAAIDARLSRRLYGRAKALLLSSGTAPASAAEQGAAGKPSPAKPAFFPDGELAQADTWIAYDLTLRCKACGSTVEKCGGRFYCDACARAAGRARGGR